MKKLLNNLVLLLGSYGLSILLMFFLLILTLFGTLEQVELGLYAAQKKYFESLFLVHYLFGSIPIPLPGAFLVMILFTVNLTVGGILRARKNWKRPGMLIAHAGILVLLIGSFVTFKGSLSGHMTLYEGEQADYFESYYDWEITVTQRAGAGADAQQWVIPQSAFGDLAGKQERRFQHPSMPFSLVLSGFLPNAAPDLAENAPEAVDGAVLKALPMNPEAAANMAGIYARFDGAEGEAQRGILWGRSLVPWVVTSGDQEWAVLLQHQRYYVPFTIALDKFTRDLHPGTMMASNYQSTVSKIEKGVSRQIEIKMNEPLRHLGYTFYQSSWGPANAGPNDRLYSTFSVVKNPTDQWPLYACYIVTFGLAVHFLQRLLRYLKRERSLS